MDREVCRDPDFIGRSPAFVRVLQLISKLSRCDAPVLIQGETGTGKELAARAIHYSGSRRGAPFVPINCGAIPDMLVESELFGYSKGAFTDAREPRSGVIAQAEGGTLFLDEIETMAPRAQVALLRFLQDLRYRPVGSARLLSADVRVIAASNTDLSALVEQGIYRQDLLYRLNVLLLEMPPLRTRGDDIILLAERFIARFSTAYAIPPVPIDPNCFARLRRHDWPGNVRELENLVLRDLLMNESASLDLSPGPSDQAPVATMSPALHPVASFRDAKAHAIERFERDYLSRLLAATAGNVAEAARLCGQERSRLNKLVRKHGLQRARPIHGM